MPSYSQSSRLGRLTTVLGSDVVVLQRFSGQEGMSALFAFEVDCLAASPEIDFDALIGTHATVTLTTRAGDRPFDGIVTEAQWLGAGENGQRYRLILRPWAFLASLRRNQRIFHSKTVVQILEELLGSYADAGALKPQLTAEYPVLEYTVQFRESDLDFACRLMERHGISYHFQHHEGQHDMVLTDMATSHASIGDRPFHPDDGHHQEDIEHFWQWRPARRITTGSIRLTDYNFKTPNAAMEVDRPGDAGYAQGKIESFDWPGGYLDQGRGRTVASLRTDAERGQDRRFEALGDVADLGAGLRVTLSGDQVPGTGDDYLCLAASHSYTSDNYGSGGAQGDALAYRGVYVLMPASAPMLPELKTPRADVRGPQTAVVVGEGEIDCDEYGRILVKFHWDLLAAHSMRCRVSQNWAGNGWGGMVIPRIGMEVVVEFLDGDPDQPLVTGCVYNAANMPPYALPANKTRSTFKSNTHQGRGYNEFRFEDELGKEEIRIHAQRDMNTFVGLNFGQLIAGNQSSSVHGNRLDEIFGVDIKAISGSAGIFVGPNSAGDLVASGLGSLQNKMSKMAYEVNDFNLRSGSVGDFNVAVDGSMSVRAQRHDVRVIGGSGSYDYGGSLSVKILGGETKSISGGFNGKISGSHYLNVGQIFCIVCGSSSITLTSDGDIEISGVSVKINGKTVNIN